MAAIAGKDMMSASPNYDSHKAIRAFYPSLSRLLHTILSQLDHCGFRAAVNEWLSLYLKKLTAIHGCNSWQNSDYGQIPTGVPLGSVLGPILFTLNVNDMVMALSLDHTCLLMKNICLVLMEMYIQSNDIPVSNFVNSIAVSCLFPLTR